MLLNTSGLRRRKPLFRDGCFFRQSVCSVIHSGTGIIIIIIHSFYIALFSALKQTHCAHWHVILNE